MVNLIFHYLTYNISKRDKIDQEKEYISQK